MDAYSTDYYDISYPGLIMKVNKILKIELCDKIPWHQLNLNSFIWGKVSNKLLPW